MAPLPFKQSPGPGRGFPHSLTLRATPQAKPKSGPGGWDVLEAGAGALSGGAEAVTGGPMSIFLSGGGGGGKRHIPPHPAQPQHTNDGAPRTRKRHPQEHRPQRPTERSDPTQHAKGRTSDCPGPCKGATTRRNVTRGGLVWFGSRPVLDAQAHGQHSPLCRHDWARQIAVVRSQGLPDC